MATKSQKSKTQEQASPEMLAALDFMKDQAKLATALVLSFKKKKASRASKREDNQKLNTLESLLNNI